MIQEELVIGLNLDSKDQPDPICELYLAGKMTASCKGNCGLSSLAGDPK
jgi:hypothetical protein